ncbi:MAG: hypothetical protein ABL888_09440, partial [Pirellulaceae bacterium]
MKSCAVLVAFACLFASATSVAQEQLVPMPETQDKTKITIELRWVSMELEENEELPKSITDLIQNVEPSKVKVIGGATIIEDK